MDIRSGAQSKITMPVFEPASIKVKNASTCVNCPTKDNARLQVWRHSAKDLTEKAYHEQLVVAEITMPVFEPASIKVENASTCFNCSTKNRARLQLVALSK